LEAAKAQLEQQNSKMNVLIKDLNAAASVQRVTKTQLTQQVPLNMYCSYFSILTALLVPVQRSVVVILVVIPVVEILVGALRPFSESPKAI
jgi:hypothetical protein